MRRWSQRPTTRVLAGSNFPTGVSSGPTATLTNTLEQTNELVLRDRCRPSVVLWSVANETFPGDERTAFIGSLIERVRSLDPTRLVTCALFTLPGQGIETHIEDPLGELIDVIGVNQYYGWYYGERADIASKRWTSEWKPIIFSELRAGAKHGNTATTARSGPRSSRLPSTSPDRDDRRQRRLRRSESVDPEDCTPMRVLPGIQDGYNRKGLVSEEGEKKLAFDVLRSWYASR